MMEGMKFVNAEAGRDYYQGCQDSCNERAMGCQEKCKAIMSTMRFVSADAQKQWYGACSGKCKVDSEKKEKEPIMCTAQYVDCSEQGGYDPTDPCKQTCNWKMIAKQGTTQLMRTARDTLKDEVNEKTEFVVKYGERVEVSCKKHWGGTVQCFDSAGKLVALEKEAALQAWSPTNSKGF